MKTNRQSLEVASLLYTASVETCQHYLGRLENLLGRVQRHYQCNEPQRSQSESRNESAARLLNAQLQSDMLAFGAQVATAAGFALRTCLPLAGKPIPEINPDTRNFTALEDWVRLCRQHLDHISVEDFAGNVDLSAVISTRAGEAELQLSTIDYVHRYGMPNFFFHLTTAYAIARQQGVPLGKGDFDGFHAYSEGVNFALN